MNEKVQKERRMKTKKEKRRKTTKMKENQLQKRTIYKWQIEAKMKRNE